MYFIGVKECGAQIIKMSPELGVKDKSRHAGSILSTVPLSCHHVVTGVQSVCRDHT